MTLISEQLCAFLRVDPSNVEYSVIKMSHNRFWAALPSPSLSCFFVWSIDFILSAAFRFFLVPCYDEKSDCMHELHVYAKRARNFRTKVRSDHFQIFPAQLQRTSVVQTDGTNLLVKNKEQRKRTHASQYSRVFRVLNKQRMCSPNSYCMHAQNPRTKLHKIWSVLYTLANPEAQK